MICRFLESIRTVFSRKGKIESGEWLLQPYSFETDWFVQPLIGEVTLGRASVIITNQSGVCNAQ